MFWGYRFLVNFARLPACGHSLRPCKRKEKRYNQKRRNKKPPLNRGVWGDARRGKAGKRRRGKRAEPLAEASPRLAEEGGTCPHKAKVRRPLGRVAEGELHLARGKSTERTVCKVARLRALAETLQKGETECYLAFRDPAPMQGGTAMPNDGRARGRANEINISRREEG